MRIRALLLLAVLLGAAPIHAAEQRAVDAARARIVPAGFVANAGQWPADVVASAPTPGGRVVVSREAVSVVQGAVARTLPIRGFAGVRASDPLPGVRNFYLGEGIAEGLRAHRTLTILSADAPLVLRVEASGLAAAGPLADAERQTFGGKTGDDYGNGIAFDGAGSAVVAGHTYSSDIPTGNAHQPGFGGSADAFVAAFAPDGTVVYATYLGGSGIDQATSIASMPDGSVLVGGQAGSSTFPTTAGAFQRTPRGWDAFAAVLDQTGRLTRATVFGGTGTEMSWDVAVDPVGRPVVFGYTTSTDLPTTPGSFMPARARGDYDAFVARLDSSLSSVQVSTYYGGSKTENTRSVAVAPNGDMLVTGTTDSLDLPVTASALQRAPSPSGGTVFVARVSASTGALVYSTYLGGSGGQFANAIASDAAGRAVVTGWTNTPDFPLSPNAYKSTLRPGEYDAFVTRLTPDGSAIDASTLFGGTRGFSTPLSTPNGNEDALGVTVLGDGSVALTGWTSAHDLPVTPDAAQPTLAGQTDVFVAVLNESLSAVRHATYLGGLLDDVGYSLAVAGSGAIAITGYTTSPDFKSPVVTVTNGPPTTNAGDHDAFVARISPGL